MSADKTRTESDSMGELQVPIDALWGAQTQRAVENFEISGLRMPRRFIRALGLIKATAAHTNAQLGLLDDALASAIDAAAVAVAHGEHDAQFPVDVFQTGSGTSSNMNANEVIARLASDACGAEVHPNDHVNHGQSSNDVIPTALHLSAALAVHEDLRPSLQHLADSLDAKADALADTPKTGRTHLMDAMPITFGQELGGWAAQIRSNIDRLTACLPRLHALAQGGTAVGTGVNAHPEFGAAFAKNLSERTGLELTPSDNYFESLSTLDTAVELSGVLKTIAVSLMKIANDLRWMNSGPLAGIGELTLPALQPGSSIMPGKVNPVIPEAVAQVAAQVIGNDATVTVAGQSGNFQLNVMLPVTIHNILQSIELIANSCKALAQDVVPGLAVNHAQVEASLAKNPVLVTALNDKIGYDLGAKIAKQAYQEKRPVIEVAAERTELSRDELEQLLNPLKLTRGGLV